MTNKIYCTIVPSPQTIWSNKRQNKLRISSSLSYLESKTQKFRWCTFSWSVNSNIWICAPPPPPQLSSLLRHWLQSQYCHQNFCVLFLKLKSYSWIYSIMIFRVHFVLLYNSGNKLQCKSIFLECFSKKIVEYLFRYFSATRQQIMANCKNVTLKITLSHTLNNFLQTISVYMLNIRILCCNE